MDLFSYFAGLKRDDHGEKLHRKMSHLLWMTKSLIQCFLLTRSVVLKYLCVHVERSILMVLTLSGSVISPFLVYCSAG